MERKIRYSILFILGFCFCCHHSINAQVIYNNDSVTDFVPPPGTAAHTFSNVTTASGTNRLLILFVSIPSKIIFPTSVTYNNQNLTLAVSAPHVNVNWTEQIWYINLGTGGSITADVEVTYSANMLLSLLAVATFQNVNQTTPIGNTNQASGQTGPSTLSVNGEANDLIIDAIYSNGFAGHSQSTIYTFLTSWGASYLDAITGSNDMTWTFVGGSHYIHVAAEINHDGVNLPVELTFFKGENRVHKNHLTWQTASESNNEGFHIERSPNGEKWETIDFRKGQGNSYDLQDYSYIDEHPLFGQNYYRLKQVDYDGRYEYSKVVFTERTSKKQGLSIYPNPVTEGEVFFQTGNQESHITILNNVGKKIHSSYFSTGVGSLDIGDLPAGIYFLNIQLEGEKYIEKIIKQ